ncbi:hypothetical protein QBE54_02740 [Thermatribacter velox]|uniref:Uncharacterized protein n=1 Tax=Thermatribacter velox TaxID=3039681 RepID=A0ABZ2YCE0_9BACT
MRQVFKRFIPEDFQYLARAFAEQGTSHFAELVRDDYRVLDVVLDDENVFKKLVLDEHLFLKVSPYFYFELLLRQAIRDIKRENYTLERIGYRERVPVFDGPKVIEAVSREDVRDYLVELLVSFVKVNNITLYIRKGRGIYLKKSISDMDFDLMLEISERVEEPYRFVFLKRAGDIALFLSGVFPEQVFGSPFNVRRKPFLPVSVSSSEELERKGKEVYRLAGQSKVAQENRLDTILDFLATHFEAVKKPLNVMTDRYLHFRKYDIFRFLQN